MNICNWPKWPKYGALEEKAVIRVIRSNQIYAAEEVKKFENEFSEYLGGIHSIGVGNATQGLHLALAALNIGVGDEVIVTPYSWISTASCILMQNAIPVFCDIEPDTLALDPKEVQKKITSKTKAIIYVHMFGYPANALALAEVARKNSIYLIEDASHAHGLEISGKKAGTLGDISVFSLHQRKALSVGDGGMVTTENIELSEKIKRLRSFGDVELSYNYRMTEFAAALGRVGLKKIDAENLIRRENAIKLSHLMNSEFMTVRLCENLNTGVYYSTLLEINKKFTSYGEEMVNKMNAIGIPIKKTWGLLNKHPHFNPTEVPARGLPWLERMGGIFKNYSEENLPNAALYCENLIFELELHPYVTDKNIIFSANNINKFHKEIM